MTNSEKSNLWLKGLDMDKSTKLRIFCFPYAGAGAAAFRQWQDHFADNINVCALQMPGREDRVGEAPYTLLSDLVCDIADVICPLLGTPFVFFGHCNGALISFELARELSRRDLSMPEHMFVSGFRAPDLVNPNPLVHQMEANDLICELKRYEGLPTEVLYDEHIMSSLIPTLRADFSLQESYQYRDQQKLNCPMTIFGGLHDNVVARKQLMGWRSITQQQSSIRIFTGGHMFINTQRQILLQAIDNELSQILESEKACV